MSNKEGEWQYKLKEGGIYRSRPGKTDWGKKGKTNEKIKAIMGRVSIRTMGE